MCIEELDNSNALEPGQLLVVLKCWRFCGHAAVCHLQQSVKSVSAVESKPASDGRIKTGHFFE